MPARDLERLVEDRIKHFLASEAEVFEALSSQVDDTSERLQVVTAATECAKGWDELATTGQRSLIRAFVQRVHLTSEALTISIDLRRLTTALRKDEPSHYERAAGRRSYADGAGAAKTRRHGNALAH